MELFLPSFKYYFVQRIKIQITEYTPVLSSRGDANLLEKWKNVTLLRKKMARDSLALLLKCVFELSQETCKIRFNEQGLNLLPAHFNST